MPKTSASSCRSQQPLGRAAEQRHVLGEAPPDAPRVGLDRRPVERRHAQRLERHALRVEHPRHVVIGDDEQRGRIRERRVLGEDARIDVAVRTDEGQARGAAVELAGDVAHSRCGVEIAVGIEHDRRAYLIARPGSRRDQASERAAHQPPATAAKPTISWPSALSSDEAPGAVPGERDVVVRERRERGQPTEHAGQAEGAQRRRHHAAALADAGQHAEDRAADRVDDERAEREPGRQPQPRRLRDAVAGHRAERPADADEQPRHAGILTVKRAPPSARFSTRTSPPCRPTRCLTIDRPRPVPPVSRERALSTR